MNTSSIEKAEPEIITNWRRFSMGLWQIPEGDIAAAYSADIMPKIRVFNHDGRMYTNGGCAFSRWVHARAYCYPLIHPEDYQGPEEVPYSHEGQTVRFAGSTYRLGPKLDFVASDPTISEWRDLTRKLYAYGGIFASECTYAQFMEQRFDPQSTNGVEARALELAECQNRQMPVSQSEMIALLDGPAITDERQQSTLAL